MSIQTRGRSRCEKDMGEIVAGDQVMGVRLEGEGKGNRGEVE